jgi:hypothetical protein
MFTQVRENGICFVLHMFSGGREWCARPICVFFLVIQRRLDKAGLIRMIFERSFSVQLNTCWTVPVALCWTGGWSFWLTDWLIFFFGYLIAFFRLPDPFVIQQRLFDWLNLWLFKCCFGWCRSRGSSVSIMSCYKRNDQAIEFQSRTEALDFSCNLLVQTGSEAHPASCTVGSGGPVPGGKAWLPRDADYSPLSSFEVMNE